jgi:cell division protein FtsW (lipid II flippase)
VAFDRRLAMNFDWVTLALSLAIVSLSIVLLYSATSERLEGPSGMHLKQLVWAVIGLVSMFVILCIDYQTLCRHAYVLYAALLVSPGHCAPVRSDREWVATLAGTRALARANL